MIFESYVFFFSEYVCIAFDSDSASDKETCSKILDEFDCGVEGKTEDTPIGGRGTCQWVLVYEVTEKPTTGKSGF